MLAASSLALLLLVLLGLSGALKAPGKRVVVFGATGYIGKYVVKESVRRGYDTGAVDGVYSAIL